MKLFDIIFGKAIDRRIAAYQNDLITKHCDEVDNIYRQMRGWRHDYHNHIQAMLAMTDNPEKLRKYLWMLNDDLTTVDTVLKTGNVMVDATVRQEQGQEQDRADRRETGVIHRPTILGGVFRVLKLVIAPGGGDIGKRAFHSYLNPFSQCPGMKKAALTDCHTNRD